jgi:type VI secretion system protein ImpG
MGVTPSLRLPLDASLHWRLIKHLAQNRSSITGRESLQQVLSLCDFHREGQEARVNQRRLDGLQSVKARNAVRLDFGFPIYGTQVEVGLRRDYFEDEGDIFIFASVLEHFFEDYAPINSFVQLIAKDDGGEELLCPRPLRRGKKPQL